MIHRFVIGLAALAAVAVPSLAPSLAIAADLAEYPVMVPVEPECAAYGGRPYDDVLQPPQTAYIVASRCSSQLDMTFLLNRREKILVYYNGGSVYKTDIDLLVVPH